MGGNSSLPPGSNPPVAVIIALAAPLAFRRSRAQNRLAFRSPFNFSVFLLLRAAEPMEPPCSRRAQRTLARLCRTPRANTARDSAGAQPQKALSPVWEQEKDFVTSKPYRILRKAGCRHPRQAHVRIMRPKGRPRGPAGRLDAVAASPIALTRKTFTVYGRVYANQIEIGRLPL